MLSCDQTMFWRGEHDLHTEREKELEKLLRRLEQQLQASAQIELSPGDQAEMVLKKPLYLSKPQRLLGKVINFVRGLVLYIAYGLGRRVTYSRSGLVIQGAPRLRHERRIARNRFFLVIALFVFVVYCLIRFVQRSF